MITLHALQIIWYVLLAFLLTGFVAFDGYDLGSGMWHLLARRGEQRNHVLATIAPFWDGNQVWLVAAGGASFAAFPPVYAALLSGLYPLLVGLEVMLVGLEVMLVVVTIGLPAVFAYTGWLHWLFRQPVDAGAEYSK